MANANVLDPSASPLDYYGYELRRQREAVGLTQEQLGGIISYTGSLVGQVETGRRLPTREFSERVDAGLCTDGFFSRLVGLVMRSQLPAWFQQVAELEARSVEICAFHTHLVHGLLQTPAYARAVLGALNQENLDDRTEVRLARQRILEKDEPPMLWLVLGEAVLYQDMGRGERGVMREQLERLLSHELNPRVNVQVLPFPVGPHAGVQGAYTLFRFPSDPAIIYTEGYGQGHPTANPPTVRDCSLRYDHLQATALSVRDSAELIRYVMEEHYAEVDERPVA